MLWGQLCVRNSVNLKLLKFLCYINVLSDKTNLPHPQCFRNSIQILLLEKDPFLFKIPTIHKYCSKHFTVTHSCLRVPFTLWSQDRSQEYDNAGRRGMNRHCLWQFLLRLILGDFTVISRAVFETNKTVIDYDPWQIFKIACDPSLSR